jgi:hypothetical protein
MEQILILLGIEVSYWTTATNLYVQAFNQNMLTLAEMINAHIIEFPLINCIAHCILIDIINPKICISYICLLNAGLQQY